MPYEACGRSSTSRLQTGGCPHDRVVGMGFADDAESTEMREFSKRGNDSTLQQWQKHIQ